MKKINIKNLMLFAFLTAIGYQANAQTTSLKLGSNPTVKDPSALLELEAVNKGILMPRIALTSTTDVTTIASPANALTVFNTATVGDVIPGYYYYSTAASKWLRVSTDAWGLTGNSGTTSGTNFLGTTDNQNLVLKAANNSLLTLGSNGKIGFGLTPDAYSVHRLQSNFSVRFGTPFDGSNQHFSLAQAPSAFSGASLQKPFSLIVGNSFLDRSDIFIGGGLWDGTEAAVQNIRFYTASTKNTPIGTERMVLDPNGNLGVGVSEPSNTLHVKASVDPVRFEGLQPGLNTDNILVVGINGVLKSIVSSALASDLRLVGNGNHITQDAGVAGNGTSVGLGISNIGIGKSVLQSNTNGGRNVSIGEASLQKNTTGFSNTAVGAGTLIDNTSGSNNIALGNSAGNSITTGSGNILIGNEVTIQDGTLSNQMNIKNAIFGRGMSGTLAVPAGFIGINEPSPNSTFQVAGSVSHNIRVLTADGTLTDSDYTVISRAAGAINLTLPDPLTCKGRVYYIINNGGGTVTTSRSFEVATNISQTTIPVAAMGIASPNQNFGNKYMLQSDGVIWVLIQLG